jgi:hypothetical protein
MMLCGDIIDVTSDMPLAVTILRQVYLHAIDWLLSSSSSSLSSSFKATTTSITKASHVVKDSSIMTADDNTTTRRKTGGEIRKKNWFKRGGVHGVNGTIVLQPRSLYVSHVTITVWFIARYLFA